MTNNKFKKSQILMLSLLAALLFITPLLSSSLRPTYLYLIINLLIVALGAEAGLLSVFFSKPPLEDKKPAVIVASKSGVVATTPEASSTNNSCEGIKEKKGRLFEKSASEKTPRGVKVQRVKKCPSTPSLFFIGNGETDHQAEEQVGYEKFYEEEEEEVGGGLSGQELFYKAENFIGNFYKQLKMQREDSWKRIHGFYQKAF